MKLRIRGNSVRLRLTQSEIDQLSRTGTVRDSVEFGVASPAFAYQLSTTLDEVKTRSTFEDHCLSISIPASVAENWIRSEQVGIEEMQPIDGNKSLRILVEKDFACLVEREGEEDIDAFPNPSLQAKC